MKKKEKETRLSFKSWKVGLGAPRKPHSKEGGSMGKSGTGSQRKSLPIS